MTTGIDGQGTLTADLYRQNTQEGFWGLPKSIPSESQEAIVAEFLRSLGAESVATLAADWTGLLQFVLGEGQFGPRRYELGALKRWYYRLRPFLPREATVFARRYYRAAQGRGAHLGWPTEDRFIRLLYQLRDVAGGIASSGAVARPFWPDGARFAFVITHDIESARGLAFVRELADVDSRHGFRSSFNFVPEGYSIDLGLLADLERQGFEVAVHGLVHDGRLFSSRAEFDRRARRINDYLRSWRAVGFRSPLTHRNPSWMQSLEIEYDSSFFDTDPYEPMPGGTMTIWPFRCGHFVELPYTLMQDHTLLDVLGEKTPRLWLDKVEFIAQWGGMALVNTHPDYLHHPAHLAVYEAFLHHMSGYSSGGMCWHALPREVARWWQRRAGLFTSVLTGSGQV